MLKLLKANDKDSKNPKLENSSNEKHYPASVREWNNSIYYHQKKHAGLIPWSTNLSMKIIKGYFNAFNKNLEKKIRAFRLILRFRRLSSNKIYFSHGEFKHTNDNLLVNLYIFNRQKYNYVLKLKNIYLKKMLSNKHNLKFSYKLINLYKDNLNVLEKNKNNMYSMIKHINAIEENNNYSISNFKSLSSYMSDYYRTLLRRSLKKIYIYISYKQLIYINRSKLNYTYLRLLKKHLEKIFNKNVEFNLINLKRFYLNSDILSESVKLKLTRNKRIMKRILSKIKNKVKIHKKKLYLTDLKYKQNTINKEYLIIKDLKHKHVTGFRLELKGRLTARYTASRSLSKLIYKGNLLNIDSSHRGLSSIILKGNSKSSIQYTKSSSFGRIGSFGIKGWISSN